MSKKVRNVIIVVAGLGIAVGVGVSAALMTNAKKFNSRSVQQNMTKVETVREAKDPVPKAEPKQEVAKAELKKEVPKQEVAQPILPKQEVKTPKPQPPPSNNASVAKATPQPKSDVRIDNSKSAYLKCTNYVHGFNCEVYGLIEDGGMDNYQKLIYTYDTVKGIKEGLKTIKANGIPQDLVVPFEEFESKLNTLSANLDKALQGGYEAHASVNLMKLAKPVDIPIKRISNICKQQGITPNVG